MLTPWSCLGNAFATALTTIGVPTTLEDVNAFIAHDGSEVVYPHLPIDLRRRGYHIQECSDFCLSKGVAVTTIVPLPFHTVRSADGKLLDDLAFVIDFHYDGKPMPHDERLELYLSKYVGVLTGQRLWNNTGHAVAWDLHKIIDGNPTAVNFNNFRIDAFYALTRIN